MNSADIYIVVKALESEFVKVKAVHNRHAGGPTIDVLAGIVAIEMQRPVTRRELINAWNAIKIEKLDGENA